MKIMTLVYIWCSMQTTISEALALTVCSVKVVVDWFNMCVKYVPVADWQEATPLPNREEKKPGSKWNYGNRITGPWVGGLYVHKDKVLFEIVPDKTSEKLLAVINKHVEPGSYIATDEWKAYCKLAEIGYIHQTVNRSKSFVDSETG